MENASTKENKQAKHKGGRPAKGIKRSYIIVVRLTAIERLLIQGKAKEAKLSPSAWFRQAAKKAKVTARLTPADLRILRMLSGMANNPNQITRLAHQEGLLSVQRRCREILDLINETLNYLNSDDRKSNDR